MSASVKATSTVSSRFCPIAPGAEGSAEPYMYDASEKTAGSKTCEHARPMKSTRKRLGNTPDNTLFDTSLPGAFDTRARVEKSG